MQNKEPTMRRRLALAAAACLLVACGGGSTADAPASAWAVLGSSTAAGVGATPGKGWVALLSASAASRGVQVRNFSRSGSVTYHALPAAAARPGARPATDPAQDIDEVMLGRPTLVILAFPSNDAVAGYAATETVANLLAIRRRALDGGAAALVQSSQPRDSATDAQRAAMRDADSALAQSLGECFVDVHPPLADSQDHIAAAYAAGDGVHLNDAGHELIFERVNLALAAGLCARR